MVELQRNAHVVRCQKCFALIWAIHPRCWAAFPLEVRFGLIQIRFIKRFKAHDFDGARLVGLLKNDTVVTAFFHCT